MKQLLQDCNNAELFMKEKFSSIQIDPSPYGLFHNSSWHISALFLFFVTLVRSLDSVIVNVFS